LEDYGEVMNMKNRMLMVAMGCMGTVLCACGPQGDSGPVDMHNSRISLDWEGTYTGTIPGADIPGIKVQIVLKSDESYAMTYQYLGKDDRIYTEKGKFKWDEGGSIITLDVHDAPPYYRVGENRLIQLDMAGKPITGDLADHYILTKITD
jgi:uncharacterized lipoprotein NlpE involved in copper resistance